MDKHSDTPKLPEAYINDGPHHGDGICLRCGKKLKPDDTVSLELDQRNNEYHDFGVPPEWSQGWFDFGKSCANQLRKRARAALKEQS